MRVRAPSHPHPRAAPPCTGVSVNAAQAPGPVSPEPPAWSALPAGPAALRRSAGPSQHGLGAFTASQPALVWSTPVPPLHRPGTRRGATARGRACTELHV